jgi:hypothetical protein
VAPLVTVHHHSGAISHYVARVANRGGLEGWGRSPEEAIGDLARAIADVRPPALPRSGFADVTALAGFLRAAAGPVLDD